MHIGLFKNMQLVFAIQMNRDNIHHWFELEPVYEISKHRRTGYFDILLSSNVIGEDNLDPSDRDTYYYAKFGDWLCRDDAGNWRCFSDEDYHSLDAEKRVYAPINKQTRHQLLVLEVVRKLESDFNNMSYEEKCAFAEKYPQFVTKTELKDDE